MIIFMEEYAMKITPLLIVLILLFLFPLVANAQAYKLVPPEYDFSWIHGNWKFTYAPGDPKIIRDTDNSELRKMRFIIKQPPGGRVSLKINGNYSVTGNFALYELRDGTIEVRIFGDGGWGMPSFTLSDNFNKLMHESGSYFQNTSQ